MQVRPLSEAEVNQLLPRRWRFRLTFKLGVQLIGPCISWNTSFLHDYTRIGIGLTLGPIAAVWLEGVRQLGEPE